MPALGLQFQASFNGDGVKPLLWRKDDGTNRRRTAYFSET